MSWTRQQLENETLQLLRLASNSVRVQLPTGSGGSPTITNSNQLGLWFDEGVKELAMRCWPVLGKATWTWTANRQQQLYNTGSGFLDGVGSTDGSELWSPEVVTWAGSPLEQYDRERLVLAGLNPVTDTASIPTGWYKQGLGFGFYPVPTTSDAVVAYGLMIPPRLTSTGQSLTWITDREAYFLALYDAWKVAAAAMDDPLLTARAPVWGTEWRAQVNNFWMNLPATLRARHYPTEPYPAPPE